MIFARFGVCLTLLLLAHPALAQTQQVLPTPGRPPVSRTLGPILQPSPSAPDPSQTQRDEARREADNARIDQGANEARDRANQRMDAATTEMNTGVSSGAGRTVTAAAAAQTPAQQGQDIETLVEQALARSAQESNADLRESASTVQRENRRRRALREQTECLPNATNADRCTCPSGPQPVNGQCAPGGN